MFISSTSHVIPTFTAVKYAVYDSDGEIHIGGTLKAYLHENRITYEELAGKISLSKTGVSSMVSKKTIDTGRLFQICKLLQHDFFKYLTLSLPENVFHEPGNHYVVPKERPVKKLVLEIEDNKVVSQYLKDSNQGDVELKHEQLMNELAKYLEELKSKE